MMADNGGHIASYPFRFKFLSECLFMYNTVQAIMIALRLKFVYKLLQNVQQAKAIFCII